MQSKAEGLEDKREKKKELLKRLHKEYGVAEAGMQDKKKNLRATMMKVRKAQPTR